MLNPATETFRGNKAALAEAVLFLVTPAGCMVALQAYKPSYWPLYDLGLLVVIGASAFALCWLLTVRVGLHPDGVSVSSFLGSKEIRWDDVDRFYYAAIQQSLNGIPTGLYYTFRLIDRLGTKIFLGHTVERPEEFGRKLVQFTQKPLLTQAINHYNSGVEVPFGPVKISRTGGVSIRTLLLKKQIAPGQIASYRLAGGKLYIFSRGEKKTRGTEIRSIPNVFALMGLLDAILKPAAPKPSPAPARRPAFSRA